MVKKLFLALTALFIAGGITTASAQVNLGVVAGVNMSKLSFDKSKYFDSDQRAGWYVGPKLWVKVPLVGLGLNVSAQYSQRRLNQQISDSEGKTSGSKNLNTIEIPLNVRYSFGLASILSLYAETGPQFGFNVGNKTVSNIVKFKSSNVTWNVGVGARLFKHLEAGVGYNIALSDFGSVYIPAIPGLTDSDMKNGFKSNTWQVQVAYLF